MGCLLPHVSWQELLRPQHPQANSSVGLWWCCTSCCRDRPDNLSYLERCFWLAWRCLDRYVCCPPPERDGTYMLRSHVAQAPGREVWDGDPLGRHSLHLQDFPRAVIWSLEGMLEQFQHVPPCRSPQEARTPREESSCAPAIPSPWRCSQNIFPRGPLLGSSVHSHLPHSLAPFSDSCFGISWDKCDFQLSTPVPKQRQL